MDSDTAMRVSGGFGRGRVTDRSVQGSRPSGGPEASSGRLPCGPCAGRGPRRGWPGSGGLDRLTVEGGAARLIAGRGGSRPEEVPSGPRAGRPGPRGARACLSGSGNVSRRPMRRPSGVADESEAVEIAGAGEDAVPLAWGARHRSRRSPGRASASTRRPARPPSKDSGPR